MKTRLASALVLVAVLSAAFVSPMFADSRSNPAKAYPVGTVERYGATIIRPGDSAVKVAAYLGSPDQKLSGDTWVYRHFQSRPDPATAEGCTTLLITFNHERVSDLQKVNEPAVKVLAAQLAAPVNTRLVKVANK